jgi:hypothetical protein
VFSEVSLEEGTPSWEREECVAIAALGSLDSFPKELEGRSDARMITYVDSISGRLVSDPKWCYQLDDVVEPTSASDAARSCSSKYTYNTDTGDFHICVSRGTNKCNAELVKMSISDPMSISKTMKAAAGLESYAGAGSSLPFTGRPGSTQFVPGDPLPLFTNYDLTFALSPTMTALSSMTAAMFVSVLDRLGVSLADETAGQLFVSLDENADEALDRIEFKTFRDSWTQMNYNGNPQLTAALANLGVAGVCMPQ